MVGPVLRALLIAGMVGFVLGAFSDIAVGEKTGSWSVGTPIVTYWAGPAMTDAAAQQMKDGGWNLVWCGEKELDVVRRNGLRAQLTDGLLTPDTLDNPTKLAALDALIARVRKNPALYCYFITDEPDAGRFAGLGRLVAHLRALDPAHLAYINLFPTYANNDQLGTTGDTVSAYDDYLRRFIDVVKPGLLSYDHYQFAVGSDMPDYFLNLSLIRKAALDANVPFLNIVQAVTWTPSMREPGEAEMRYLVYTSLAYGAMGISYYVYAHEGHTPGIATLDGKPTRVYEWLSKLNPEFVAIASEVEKLHSVGVYHAGMFPTGAIPIPADSTFRFDPPVPTRAFVKSKPVTGVLLGCFAAKPDGQAREVVVVNLDYLAPASYTITGPSNLQIFDADLRKWTSCHSKRVTLQLTPGGGKLLRLLR